MIGKNCIGMLFVASVLTMVGCTADAGEEDDQETSSEALSAPTCAPSLAAGAVPAKHRAMLNTIAFTEGTAGSCGQDGYNTGYSYKCFSSCNKHPNIVWTAGGYSSSAAGRYQFLNSTWKGLNLPSFSPKNQDIGGMKLIARRGVTLPTNRALTATEFTNAMKKLSYEWASLPYSPYGQPTKSLSTTRAKYCSFADCSGGSSTPTGKCVAGSNYCGGDKVKGDSRSLYRCNADGSGTLITKCGGGCRINLGNDDSCKAPVACTVGGSYCGGDKINGDPNVLYRCGAGGTTTVIRKCANGCRVNAGDDDSCN
jgi:muramidase (phage lysozyme)